MIKRTFCVLLICLLLTVWAAGSVIPGMARDEKTLLRCFDAYAQTTHLGVGKSEYPLFAQTLAAFFRGETDDPNVAAYPFFDYEVTHLHDVRGLMNGIHLTARIALALAACAVVILALLLWQVKRQKQQVLSAFSAAWLWGFFLYITVVVLITVFAALDFNRMFVLLHKLLFTNELWQLNRRTDLLIALMPEGMFMHLALEVLYHLLPLLGAFCLITMISEILRKKSRKQRP